MRSLTMQVKAQKGMNEAQLTAHKFNFQCPICSESAPPMAHPKWKVKSCVFNVSK